MVTGGDSLCVVTGDVTGDECGVIVNVVEVCTCPIENECSVAPVALCYQP